jgi:Tfp pilus assembly protein PilW
MTILLDEQRDYNGRMAMNLTRRDLAAAGVFALSATTLIVPAMAATDDEEAVKQAVSIAVKSA